MATPEDVLTATFLLGEEQLERSLSEAQLARYFGVSRQLLAGAMAELAADDGMVSDCRRKLAEAVARWRHHAESAAVLLPALNSTRSADLGLAEVASGRGGQVTTVPGEEALRQAVREAADALDQAMQRLCSQCPAEGDRVWVLMSDNLPYRRTLVADEE